MCLYVLMHDYLSLGVISRVFVLEEYFRHLVSKGNLVNSIWGLFLVFQVGIIIFIKLLVDCGN